MKLLGVICCFLLLVSLLSPGAPCPDLSDISSNLTFVEKLEMAEIVVYVQAVNEEDGIKYKVECVMKTDGFMVDEEIELSRPTCEGASDLPEFGEYQDNTFVALIKRTATGYTLENFGYNQTAHIGNVKLVKDLNEACDLAPCPSICANIISKPCPWDKFEESPLLNIVNRIDQSPISIEYQAAPWTFTACCRSKTYPGATTKLTVSDNGTEVSPRLMRKVPKLVLEDDESGKYHTVLMADVSGLNPELGTKTKPYIHWLQINVKKLGKLYPNNTIFSYERPLPRDPDHANRYAFFVFEQEQVWENCDVLDKKKDDRIDHRRHFDISKFQKKGMLELVYGAYVKSKPEAYTKLERGASILSICEDTWDDLVIVGKNVVCTGSDVNTGTTPQWRGKLMGALLGLIAMIYKLI